MSEIMEASSGAPKRKIAELAAEVARLDENLSGPFMGKQTTATSSSLASVTVESLGSDFNGRSARNVSKTVDPVHQNKNISIYHLLLDAQVDIKSDGQRIVCSKVFNTQAQARKRRKGPSSSSSQIPASQRTPSICGNDPNRASVVSGLESALNSGETERLIRFCCEHCHPDCILQIDLSTLAKKYGVHIFREIRGVGGVQSYFCATMNAVPDAITFYHQSKVTKLEDGGKEIEAQMHMMGIQVYEIDVIDEEEVHNEQDRIAMAVAALIGGSGPSDPPPESSSSSNTSLATNNNNSLRRRSLDSLPILLAQGKVEFRCGAPFQKSTAINHRGTFTWQLSPSKKIVKMKFTLQNVV